MVQRRRRGEGLELLRIRAKDQNALRGRTADRRLQRTSLFIQPGAGRKPREATNPTQKKKKKEDAGRPLRKLGTMSNDPLNAGAHTHTHSQKVGATLGRRDRGSQTG